MIVRPFDGRLLLVRQTDHMTLSGRLAEAWGNERFSRPEPYDPLVQAAAEHDIGWAQWEAAPKINPATRRPYNFGDLPVDEHLAFYRSGVDQVVESDLHAGLLVNLHCQGLYNSRFGSAPDLTMRNLSIEQDAAIRRTLAGLQAQERVLGRQVTINLPVLWAQYEMLQVFDVVSLVLCMPPFKPLTIGPLTLRPVGENGVAVDPWPFRDSTLTLGVPGRLIADRDYADDDDLRQELARGETANLRYSLKPSKV
jgi:hypothetical protein